MHSLFLSNHKAMVEHQFCFCKDGSMIKRGDYVILSGNFATPTKLLRITNFGVVPLDTDELLKRLRGSDDSLINDKFLRGQIYFEGDVYVCSTDICDCVRAQGVTGGWVLCDHQNIGWFYCGKNTHHSV